MSISDRRLRLGWLAIYVEPRDAWIGAYIAPNAVFVCLLPCVVLRWTRRVVNLGRRRLPPIATDGCTSCDVGAGERHDRRCWAIPADWFTIPVQVLARRRP